MLILAGVSLNALVGDNGIIKQSMYATFLNELTEVNEAYRVWKIANDGDALPTKGLCKTKRLKDAERLIGEIGYYRIWCIEGKMPTSNLKLSSIDFNNLYSSEVVYNPNVVEDIYVLDNELLDVKSEKEYIIDASTEMIYALDGFSVNGTVAYSLSMLTALKSGEMKKVEFASYDIGSGDGKKHAGNVTTEYLYDEFGNILKDENNKPVKNPDYDPAGFQIIANNTCDNIFKLYNNGDLYGKGIKGTQLNNTEDEMDEINQYIWNEFVIPANIGNVKKIVVGCSGSMYFIDENEELWVIGNNNANKFGLDEEQLKEFTEREVTKVDLNGKKVKKIFPELYSTWLVLDDNKLYVAGSNICGEAGIGSLNSTTKFEPIQEIENVDMNELTAVHGFYTNQRATVLEFTNNLGNKTFYMTGQFRLGQAGTGGSKNSLTFIPIWSNVASSIKQVIALGEAVMIIKKDGTVWNSGYTEYVARWKYRNRR